MLVLLVLRLHMLKSLQLPQLLKHQFTTCTAHKIYKGVQIECGKAYNQLDKSSFHHQPF